MNIEKVIGSKAKFKVLEVLASAEVPLPLRQLSELAGLLPRSVQLAVDDLEKMGWVQSKYQEKRRYLNWTPKNKAIVTLFDNLRTQKTQMNATNKLSDVIEFSDEILHLKASR